VSERPVTSSYVSVLAQEPPLSPPSIGSAPLATPPPLPPFEPLRTVAPPAPPAPVEVVEQVVSAPAPQPEPEAPAAEAPTRALLPLESLLLRFGMITLDQLNEAMRDEAVTGTPVSRYIVERGWVSDEDIARVVTPPENPPAPPIATAPAPSVHPAPTPVPDAPPEPEPQARPAVTFQVLAHLATGERIEIARSDDAASARSAAAKVMREIAEATTDWPFLAGRFVRPEAIVSIDVAPLA
jgi:DNA polymerase III subunit gamma/tau